MTDRPYPQEALDLLKNAPDTRTLELLLPDMNGILRGKRVGAGEFGKVFRDGVNVPGSNVMLDARGNTFDTIRQGGKDGDPDVIARIVPGSLAPVPWASVPTAQALIAQSNVDGTPYYADSRTVLGGVVARFTAIGLTPVVATELEFYLLEESPGDLPAPRHGRIPGTALRQVGPQVYSLDELSDYDAFLNDVHDACVVQNIPSGTAISEFGPGQFEINLHHVDDAVLACDHAVLLKRAVKATALCHGLAASFMAKPFSGYAGCGLHVHVSLLDAKGQNVFAPDDAADARAPFSDKLRHAVGGLGEIMPQSMAIFAPNANSYRRFRPNLFVPLAPTWGVNHRSVALRVPLSDAAATRVEHRVAGADANPYLVMAAILAGIHHGLANACEPALPMVAEGEDAPGDATLPRRWDEALDVFEKAAVLPDYLGRKYADLFAVCRRTESDRFHAEVTNRDYEWYLRCI